VTAGDAGVAVPATVAMHRKSSASAASSWVGTKPGNASSIPKEVSAAPATRRPGFSVRAENVLKVLAAEVMGENPPRGSWTPSGQLRKLDFNNLAAARKCGPQTTEEIIRWAKSQGVVIERPPTPANHYRRCGGILLRNLRGGYLQARKLRKRWRDRDVEGTREFPSHFRPFS
jgi:hypothetical protein